MCRHGMAEDRIEIKYERIEYGGAMRIQEHKDEGINSTVLLNKVAAHPVRHG